MHVKRALVQRDCTHQVKSIQKSQSVVNEAVSQQGKGYFQPGVKRSNCFSKIAKEKLAERKDD